MEKAASKGAIANNSASVGLVRQVALAGDVSCEPVAPDAASSSSTSPGSTSPGSTSPGSVPAVQGALDPTVRLAGFDERVIKGGDARYQEEVERLARVYGFDFVAIGLAPFLGAPLKWVYFSGATSARVTRIVLSPGHGIGGIVLKSGQPMMLTDIDNDLDPREYSSYPAGLGFVGGQVAVHRGMADGPAEAGGLVPYEHATARCGENHQAHNAGDLPALESAYLALTPCA